MGEVQSFKQKFRAGTLGAHSTRKTELVHVTLGDGETVPVMLRAPSLAVQEAAQEAAGISYSPLADGKVSTILKHPLRFQVEMLIRCCFEPRFNADGSVSGIGEALFDATDRDSLMDEAGTGWLKQLSDLVMNFTKEKPETAAKNSGATSTGVSALA